MDKRKFCGSSRHLLYMILEAESGIYFYTQELSFGYWPSYIIEEQNAEVLICFLALPTENDQVGFIPI